MRRKYRIILAVMFCALLAAYIFRVIQLNETYPNPEIISAETGNELVTGNYVWKLEQIQWQDGSFLKEKFPGYVVAYNEDGSVYPSEKERVVLIHISVTKNSQDDTWLDLTEIAFESGSWHNQCDMELFEKLNPQIPGMRVQMEAGSSQEIIFPVLLLEDQFTKGQWRKVEEREMAIDTVLGCYPIKYIFTEA